MCSNIFNMCLNFLNLCLNLCLRFLNLCLNILKWFGSKLINLIDNEQFWNYIKLIPLLNTIVGLVRVIRNLISWSAIKFSRSQVSSGDQEPALSPRADPQEKSDKIERLRSHRVKAIKSGLYAIAGIAAVLIPINYGVSGLWAFLLCTAINNFIGGFGSFIVDICNYESLRIAYYSHIEDVIYKRVIKETPVIAVGYCPIRGLVYFNKCGDKRQAKISGKDLIINIFCIAVAYIMFLLIDSSKLIAWIDENIGSIQNGFTSDVLYFIRELLSSHIFTLLAAQCINVCAQLVRNSSLIMDAKFKFYDPKDFINCLKNHNEFRRDESDNVFKVSYLIQYVVKFLADCDNAYMKSHLIQYVVKCLAAGQNITNDQGNGKSALGLAFDGRNPAVLQAVIAFTPTLLERPSQRTIIDGMLNENDSDSNRCVKYILRRCLEPAESITDLICCGGNPSEIPIHKQYSVILKDTIVNRPLIPRQCHRNRVLTIDGGGTRGVVSVEILRQLEKLCKVNIRVYFDLIVGTSTGGLIALLLADGRRCKDIQKLYFELKDKVFCGRKGNVSEFERLLKEHFGERLMRDISNSTRVVITASLVQYNEFVRKDFTNIGETSEVPIWKVARCTSAAPGFFPPFNLDGELFLDGGLTANNPVFVVFDHLKVLEIENSTIVSIGTGKYYPDTRSESERQRVGETARSERVYVSLSIFGQLWMGISGSLDRLVKLLVNKVTQTDGDIVDNARIMCHFGKGYFYRLNPVLPEKLELNETNDEKLVNAIWQTKVFLCNNYSIIEDIADKLVEKEIFLKHRDSKESDEAKFEKISELGKGTFADVYQVRKKSDNLYYAIKVLKIRDTEKDLKWIKLMSDLNHKFVIQYSDSWIESRDLFNKSLKIETSIFIEMEWSSYNLRTFLEELNIKIRDEILNYFISCELLIELIEHVNFLHKLTPQIIHRNLKPENILIMDYHDETSGGFLKLCDFGSKTPYIESVDSAVVGPLNYMAPEVLTSTDYYPQSDIYSIALIATEIFKFSMSVEEIRNDINFVEDPSLRNWSPNLKENFRLLKEILTKCLSEDYKSRPDSKKLLNSVNELNVDKNTLIDFRSYTSDNEILEKFIKTKFHLHESRKWKRDRHMRRPRHSDMDMGSREWKRDRDRHMRRPRYSDSDSDMDMNW